MAKIKKTTKVPKQRQRNSLRLSLLAPYSDVDPTQLASAIASRENVLTQTKKPRVPLIKRSGLIFPPRRIQRYMRNAKLSDHIGTKGSIYCAAVLEYVVAEILEVSGNVMKESAGKRKRINPRDLMLGIQNDDELRKVFPGTVPHAGVVPGIHKVLLPKSREKSLKKSKGKSASEKSSNEVIEGSQNQANEGSQDQANEGSQNQVIEGSSKEHAKPVEVQQSGEKSQTPPNQEVDQPSM